MGQACKRIQTLFAVFCFTSMFLSSAVAELTQAHAKTRSESPPATRRVLIIGGSAALGWKDDGWYEWKQGWHGGYLVRAFQSLSKQTGIQYEIYDKASPGLNSTILATRYRGRYESWINTIHPDIVVISWGMMNDTRPRTPMSVFRKHIEEEIAEALGNGALVFIVTPPVTTASYTRYKELEPKYIQAEIDAAESFHYADVYVFDLFRDMQQAVSASGRSYRLYEGDAIHPNHLGHQLAGDILASEIKTRMIPIGPGR